MKRGLDMELIDRILEDLIEEKPLDAKHRDHALAGSYRGHRECHIQPDWLLVYQVGNGVIAFERTGTHADLFP